MTKKFSRNSAKSSRNLSSQSSQISPFSQVFSSASGAAISEFSGFSRPNKNLGQHWLFDREILREIVNYADVKSGETILEIGSGLGSLTAEILARGAHVVAVEFDENLAKDLRKNVAKILNENEQNLRFSARENGENSAPKIASRKSSAGEIADQNLEIFNEDFLKFNLENLPRNYKIVANIPYNITAPIVAKILRAANAPQVAVLLVQKEVAERLAARAGEMSVLAVAAQLRAAVSLGVVVPPDKFTPPPQVDSQVAILRPRARPLFAGLDEKTFFRVVKAGFSARRKKLRSSLAGGLNIAKIAAENLLNAARISPDARAQDLTLEQWYNLSRLWRK